MERYYGVGRVEVLPFDRAMMEMPWDRFITDVVVGRFHAVHIVVGHDHRFGYRGQGRRSGCPPCAGSWAWGATWCPRWSWTG